MGKEKKKKKPREQVDNNYTQSDMEKALEALNNGMSTRKVARLYKIPRSTLYTKFKNYVPINATKGRTPYLIEEEKNIVEWFSYCHERGFPTTKEELFKCVQNLVLKLEKVTPFKDNKPGRHWYESFCKRNPEIANIISRKSKKKNPNSVSNDMIKKWFIDIKCLLDKENLINIDSSRVYTMDERALFLFPTDEKVLAKRESQMIHEFTNDNEDESLTVLFTVNASGIMLPPMILFWYDKIPTSIINSMPSDWITGVTNNRWISAENFYNYITTKFYPWLIDHKVEFPVILYLDRRAPYFTLDLYKFCKEKCIELIGLYSNTLQPLEVSLFDTLKNKWKLTVDQWKSDNGFQNLEKYQFAPLIKATLDSIDNLTEIIKLGFQNYRLYPFDYETLDFNVLSMVNETNEEAEFNNVSNSLSINKTEEENIIVNLSEEQKEATKHLQHLENYLTPTDLRNFQDAYCDYTVIVKNENQGLFQYWIELKRLSGQMLMFDYF